MHLYLFKGKGHFAAMRISLLSEFFVSQEQGRFGSPSMRNSSSSEHPIEGDKEGTTLGTALGTMLGAEDGAGEKVGEFDTVGFNDGGSLGK